MADAAGRQKLAVLAHRAVVGADLIVADCAVSAAHVAVAGARVLVSIHAIVAPELWTALSAVGARDVLYQASAVAVVDAVALEQELLVVADSALVLAVTAGHEIALVAVAAGNVASSWAAAAVRNVHFDDAVADAGERVEAASGEATDAGRCEGGRARFNTRAVEQIVLIAAGLAKVARPEAIAVVAVPVGAAASLARRSTGQHLPGSAGDLGVASAAEEKLVLVTACAERHRFTIRVDADLARATATGDNAAVALAALSRRDSRL